jgi:hypothetical protein
VWLPDRVGAADADADADADTQPHRDPELRGPDGRRYGP